MPDPSPARLYLVTPDQFEPEPFASDLAKLFDNVPIACLRLDLGGAAEDDWRRAANHLLPVCHDAEIPLVIAEHYRMVRPLGLDGVHLRRGVTPVRSVRKELGADAIVGAEAGNSKHTGMTLAEAGADYVTLGPVTLTGSLGGEGIADLELFIWWSEMIETPVVAEGGVDLEAARDLAACADFMVPDRGLWRDPAELMSTLKEMAALLAD
ncbi:MAG: thiamine phosphate synthase [Pseudomonadota bacterium]